jgi:hypothetical protein
MAAKKEWIVGETIYALHNNQIKKGTIIDLDSETDKHESYRIKFPGWITWLHSSNMFDSIDDLITNLKVKYADEQAKETT